MNPDEKAFAEQMIENKLDENKCLWKAILEYRKLDYIDCSKCNGYELSCEYYQKIPAWYEDDR